MSEEKELLILISSKLDMMSLEIKDLRTRIDSIEGKADDIHHFVPFVEWLETVGQNLSQKFRWLKGYKDPPVLNDKNTPLITNEISENNRC
jgi:hypothetical protein